MVTSLDKRKLVTLLSFVCGSVLSVMVCLLILLVSLVRYFLPEHLLFYLFIYKRLLNYFSSVKHNYKWLFFLFAALHGKKTIQWG